MRKSIALIALLALTAAACNDTADAGDGGVERGPATVEEVSFLFLESFPVQVQAIVTGTVPTPCHEAIAEVTDTDEEGRTITLEVVSEFDPDQVCAQVIESFQLTVEVGSFESGTWTLVIDGAEYPFTI